MKNNLPLATLTHHVTGAIERGEAVAITEQKPIKFSFWHWPDHVIGKRESRRLREEHNAALNLAHELLQECKHSLAEYSALPESRLSQLDKDRIASLKAVIAKAGGDL